MKEWQPEEDDCFANPRQFWQVENQFSGHSYIGPIVSSSNVPPHHSMEKEPQHEIYIKESILRLHSVSYLGTKNLFIVSENKSCYLLLVANGLYKYIIFFFFSCGMFFLFFDMS